MLGKFVSSILVHALMALSFRHTGKGLPKTWISSLPIFVVAGCVAVLEMAALIASGLRPVEVAPDEAVSVVSILISSIVYGVFVLAMHAVVARVSLIFGLCSALVYIAAATLKVSLITVGLASLTDLIFMWSFLATVRMYVVIKKIESNQTIT